MNFELITVGPYEVNCAIVWKNAEQAIIIDPGCDAKEIESFLKRNNLQTAAYLLTHGHSDHISALAELYENHPAPIYLHPADQQWAFGPNNQIPPYYSVPEKPSGDIQNPCPDAVGSNVWKIAGLSFQCLETPGHTPGGVSYWFMDDGVCFTGDTLFKGSCGRTDLPGGNARILTDSLRKLAETLPPETQIVAGHGDRSTMERELATNFFLQKFKS